MQVAKSVENKIESVAHPVIAVPDMQRLEVLTNDRHEEVINFLNTRPVHTVVMTSMINDNGLESELNRGTFFGYRNGNGILEGVALIGHTTLVEARSTEALQAFALTARQSEVPLHVLMAGGTSIEEFWTIYKQDGSQPRLSFTEKLFEIRFPFPVQECEWDVRLADECEIEQIAVAHAQVALMESGVNPMEADREGFFKRCLRRIENNRTFVVFENGKLIFKADIVAETENAIYLEGVYVSEDMRGRGIGAKCLARLSSMLLARVENICLLSNLKFESAHRCFEKAGFYSKEACTTLFV